MEKKESSNPWLRKCLNALVVLFAMVVLVVEYGFQAQPLSSVYLHFCAVLAVLLLWGTTIYTWITLREKVTWREPCIYILFILLWFIGWYFLPSSLGDFATESRIRWGTFHLYLMILVMLRAGRWSVAAAGQAPTQALLISFATIIFAGAILLMLPSAHRIDRLGFTDACFTATSATCVTGLVVKDTGGDFTRFGQTIILCLMQLGGLGIMIFGALFALLLGSPLSLRESVAMRDIMNEQAPGRIGKVIVFIFIVTLTMEFLGVLGLYGLWTKDALRGGPLYQSIFHSVSAFCNAGFSLHTDSLCAWGSNVRVFCVICPLIILGGLGFPVLSNLWQWLFWHILRLCRHQSPILKPPVRLSLHSKIVLTTSFFLVITGALLILILELTRQNNSVTFFHGKIYLDALFNSITVRTAGFNTIDINQLGSGSKLVLILLMCIGGSPSSTAGGIKTVTFAVMVLAIYATMRRRPQVQAFHRSIPIMIVRRTSTLIMLYGLLLWIMTLLLTITERSKGHDLMDLLFEVTSALGTVGLTTGITAHLTIAGKWVVIAAMFVGRLGPLSLLAALTFNTQSVRYEYPREPLIVG